MIVENKSNVERSDADVSGLTSKLLNELSSRAGITSDRLSDVSIDRGSTYSSHNQVWR